MAKSNMMMTVKVGRTTVSPKTMYQAGDLFFEEIENKAYNIVANNLAIKYQTAVNRWYTIVATFFQRVCARTPLDEKYINGIDENGNLIMHYPDSIRCRFDWYIECGSKRVSALQMLQGNWKLFNEYNDASSISYINKFLKEQFNGFNFDECIIGNDNPHFAILEYGGYKHDTAARQGIVENDWETGEKHGVKNKHSMQAPVGMLRVTQMELESILRSSAVTPDSYRFKNQNTQKDYASTPEGKRRLKQLASKFKASKRLKLSDIKRGLL